jgi:hypothetical protein
VRIRLLAPAAAGAVLLGAVAGPAVASTTATTSRPAAGTATSALTLLGLALAGHDVSVGTVALTSDTVSGTPAAKVVVTPLTADGKAYGEQTVTPANSPASVPSFDSSSTLPALLGTVASVKSPVFTVSSSDSSGASSKAGAASLGSASILGLPVKLDGTIDVSSLVDGTNAAGEKTLTVKNLALPSIADILGALGLNLKALPVKTLTDLLGGLNLTDSAVTTAQAALDAASATIKSQTDALQSQIDSNQAKLDAAKTTLATQLQALDAAKLDLANSPAGAALVSAQQANTAAQTQLASANAQLSAANSALAAAQAALSPLGVVSPTLTQAVTDAQNAVNSATTTANQTAAALTQAQSAATALTTAVNAAQSLVDAAQKTVDGLTTLVTSLLDQLKTLLGQLGPQLNNLIAAVTAVLDNTPLVSIDSFTVQTLSSATSAAAGGQTAKVVGGEIQGVHVLGTDVLANVLGNTKVNVLDLAGSTLSQVTSKINGLTGVLSSVLSAVPGLAVPAPTVGLLTKTTSTDVVDGFGTAADSVHALQVSLPAITLPAALALPGAASLPAITGVPSLKSTLGIAAVGDLTSKAMTLSLGTLSESAKFRPAVAAVTPGTPSTPSTPSVPSSVGTPELPRTGLPAGIAIFGILLVGGGLVLRRRLAPQE